MECLVRRAAVAHPAGGANRRITPTPPTVVLAFDDDRDKNDTRITALSPAGQTVSTGKTARCI